MTEAVSYILGTGAVALPLSVLVIKLHEVMLKLYTLNSLFTSMPFG